jgi:hypothetical protein
MSMYVYIVTDLIKALPGNSPVNTVQHATIDEAVFSVWSVPRRYKSIREWEFTSRLCEDGSNTSTVTLRVVGGDEKGSLKSETVKYGRESQGSRTRE